METQLPVQKAIKSIRLQFAKYNQQAYCSFELTKYYLEGSCPTAIYQQILYSIIKVQSSNRSQWMISTLFHLTQKYPYFTKHFKEAQQCCKYLEYKKVSPNAEVIEYGSDPDYFYIILEGQVNIFIKRTVEELEEERKRIENRGKDGEFVVDHEVEILNKKHFIQKGVCKFKFITHIKEGGSFGQLGMLYNKPRMAMVVAKTPCIFGALKKEDYLSIFYEEERMLRNRKKKFISEVVLTELKKLRYEIMEGILYRFQEKNFSINQLLFKQNDLFHCFYIVFEGEVLLFNNVGKLKKPIVRIGRGGVICSQQLKLFVNKNQLHVLKYSAEVSSSSIILYKLQASEILKIFDYKEVFGSIVKNLPQKSIQKQIMKPILKQQLLEQTGTNNNNYKSRNNSYSNSNNISRINNQQLSDQSIKNYLKNQMMDGIPKTTKQSVNEVRQRRKERQREKENENMHRKSSMNLSKFKLNLLGRLSRNTQTSLFSNTLNVPHSNHSRTSSISLYNR